VAVGEGADHLELSEVHRFSNGPVPMRGSLHWDVVGLYREVMAGLREVVRTGPLDGIGIDSWAIDYGLLDRDGELLGTPYCYRDRRTDGVPERVAASVSATEAYAVTGLQQLPFTTIYQLVAARGSAAVEAATTLLLVPDLFGYWLTGEVGAERTNASTTGLYDVREQQWAGALAERAGIPQRLLPPLRDPGDRVGAVTPEVASELGLEASVPVIAVGSHDTASAVVGVPAEGSSFAYISSGTWSLVGLELDEPVLTEAAREADFTNETGVDGTIRFLKNVMGLWVLSECVRAWQSERDEPADLTAVLAGAAQSPGLRTVIDIDHPALLHPGTSDPMPQRVARLAERAGEPVPETRAALTRCVLDSLALAYRRHVRTAGELAAKQVEVLHVVGGGSQNELLCRLTADACGLPVLAGPSEAAALGNVLVQARALGADLPDLAAMRALVRRTHLVRRHEPHGGLDWAAAEARLRLGDDEAV
jgi:sugar (pentulose or hexulose) kinase